MQDGNVAIQYSVIEGVPTFIWLPEVCNNYQVQALKDLNNKISEIYKNNKNYFDAHPITFNIPKPGTYEKFIKCENTLQPLIDQIGYSIKVDDTYVLSQ